VLFTTDKILLSEDSMESRPISERPSVQRTCPRCESQSVARSRIRGTLGQAAKRMLGLRPYRCLDCWHRFIDSVA
jgi:hypothetical protein